MVTTTVAAPTTALVTVSRRDVAMTTTTGDGACPQTAVFHPTIQTTTVRTLTTMDTPVSTDPIMAVLVHTAGTTEDR